MIQSAQADGYKKPTEDRILIQSMSGDRTLVAVFDGHGGHQVSEIAKHAIARLMEVAAEDIANHPKVCPELCAVIKDILAKLDRKLIRYKNVGSTASIAIITPTHVVGAFLGDSPILMFTPEGRLLHATGDHHPSHPDEEKRIKSHGGIITQHGGDVARVGGVLSLSRALGDHGLKPAVSADADTFIWKRPTRGILAIASDGMLETPSGGRTRPALARLIVDGRFNAAAIVAEQERLMNFSGDNLSLILANVSAPRRRLRR
jgi:serine/threonine protein phosphatase PrpC